MTLRDNGYLLPSVHKRTSIATSLNPYPTWVITTWRLPSITSSNQWRDKLIKCLPNRGIRYLSSRDQLKMSDKWKRALKTPQLLLSYKKEKSIFASCCKVAWATISPRWTCLVPTSSPRFKQVTETLYCLWKGGSPMTFSLFPTKSPSAKTTQLSKSITNKPTEICSKWEMTSYLAEISRARMTVSIGRLIPC